MRKRMSLIFLTLAMAFASEHPGVSSAIIGPRTLAQTEELLRGLEVTLAPSILDRIDALVPPGTDLDARVRACVQRPIGRRAAWGLGVQFESVDPALRERLERALGLGPRTRGRA